MSGYQGSLLEFNLIKSKVRKLSEDLGQDASYSFTVLCLMQYLGLDQYTAEDCITDGADDCGIDAIYYDTENLAAPIIYLFQVKHYQANKYDRAFEGAAVDKILQAIDLLFLQPRKNRQYTNTAIGEKLRQYDEEFRDNTIPKFKIVFCSNSYPPAATSLQKVHHWLEEHNSFSDDSFEPVNLHLKEIAKLLAPDQRKSINDNLRLSGTWFSYESGTARTVVGRISVEDLTRLYDKHGEFLFDKNVRSFLKDSNPVNQNIRNTLISEKSHDFFYLNNGITIICNKLNYSPLNNDPVVSMEGLQIVNGSQTAHTIHLAFKDGLVKNKEHVFVLVKIIQTEDANLLSNITDATNSQTAVTSRDLRSNDPAQKYIEEHLRSLGYYYEARVNKYINDEKIKPEQRIDAATAAQVWLAFNLQKPADSRKKSQIFRDPLYKEVFPDNLDVRAYLDAYLLFKQIHKLGKSKKDEYPFVNYAKFHIMAMMKQCNILDTKGLGGNQDRYDKILEAIKTLVTNAQKGRNFKGYGAFFNQPSLLGRIAEKYESMHGGEL